MHVFISVNTCMHVFIHHVHPARRLLYKHRLLFDCHFPPVCMKVLILKVCIYVCRYVCTCACLYEMATNLTATQTCARLFGLRSSRSEPACLVLSSKPGIARSCNIDLVSSTSPP